MLDLELCIFLPMTEGRGHSPHAGLHNRTVLFRAGNWVFATYGPVMAAAHFVGFGVGAWYAAMQGVDPRGMLLFFSLMILPSALIGCRMASLMLDWRDFLRSPVRTLLRPGFVLQGGILGGALALIVYGIVAELEILLLLDAAAFAMPVSEAIGRLGCHVYGCCWGRPSGGFFGVRYTNPESKVLRCAPDLHGVRLHPAPLYATAILVGLHAVFLTLLPHQPFTGFFAAIYLLIHPLFRVFLESYRSDDRGRIRSRFTHTQAYAGAMFLCGLGLLLWCSVNPSPVEIDLGYGYFDLMGNPAHVALLGVVALMGFAAFGVHYKRVGTWLSSHDQTKR